MNVKRLARGGSLAFALAAVLSAAQNPPPVPPQGQQPVFRAGANFVLVDAYPQKDGRIVEGLKASDFQVFEDGKPQTIENFEFVRVEGNLPESARRDPSGLNEMREIAADPHNRVFVTFLDTRHTTVDGSHNIRAPLVNMLDRVVGPTDLFGVMTENMRPQDLTLGRRSVTVAGMLEKYWTWGERQRYGGHDPDDRGEDDLTECFHSRLTPLGWVDWIVNDGPIRRFLDEVLIDRRREDMTFKALEALVAYLPQVREARTVLIVVTDGWLLYQRDAGLANEPGRDLRPERASAETRRDRRRARRIDRTHRAPLVGVPGRFQSPHRAQRRRAFSRSDDSRQSRQHQHLSGHRQRPAILRRRRRR